MGSFFTLALVAKAAWGSLVPVARRAIAIRWYYGVALAQPLGWLSRSGKALRGPALW
jgi:hypothetical protein